MGDGNISTCSEIHRGDWDPVSQATVGIVDYGVGNLGSLLRAFADLGSRPKLAADVETVRGCDLLVLPGVGTAKTAMGAMRESGLQQEIGDRVLREQPTLGICLGLQVLGTHSAEGDVNCLGLLPVTTVKLAHGGSDIGWFEVQGHRGASADPGPYFFSHSYFVKGADDLVVSRKVGSQREVAEIRLGALTGVQFHPEKSQRSGRRFLDEYMTRVLA